MSSIDTEILTKEEKNKKSKVIATIVAGSVITVATIGLVVGVSGAAQTKVDRNVDQLSKTNPDQRNKLDETLNAISRKITSEKKANKEKYDLEQKAKAEEAKRKQDEAEQDRKKQADEQAAQQQAEQQAQQQAAQQQAEQPKSVETTPEFTSSSVSATTQYSHTEMGHYEGQVYTINSSIPSIVQNSDNTITVSGNISRGNIGLEKGSITLSYQLLFDNQGKYISGSVTSSGYVTAEINLVPGQKYIGQSVIFVTSSTGRAGSGSLIYPINGTLLIN